MAGIRYEPEGGAVAWMMTGDRMEVVALDARDPRREKRLKTAQRMA